MQRYPKTLIDEARKLRSEGKTYGEIRSSLKQQIPKSTLSFWCKNVILPINYLEKIADLNINNLNRGRVIALQVNRGRREKYLRNIDSKNLPIAKKIHGKDNAKIALAMLCLGEAAKYNPKGGAAFYFGNSNPTIILTYLALLRQSCDFNSEKLRCTIQCRADQDTRELEAYWIALTKIPKHLFYKTRIDSRTIGKPTRKLDYKGVLRIDYLDNNVRLELESLSRMIYNQLLIR